MLDAAYLDTYRRYKSGTKAVVQWLAETAGYEATTSKSKSKSKKAKLNADIKLPSSVLPDLASKIAKSSTYTGAPRHILLTLRSVISARKECGRLYQSPIDTDNGKASFQSNNGHERLSEHP